MNKLKLDTRSIALIAVMVAVTCIITMFARIPMAQEYIHCGDIAANFVAVAFGPWFGLIVAGGGMALADLLGYPQWAIPTFVIHGLQGFVVGYIAYLGRRSIASLFAGAIVGEIIVIVGYFLVGWIMTGLPAATAMLPFNGFQGVLGLLGVPLFVMVARAYPPLLRRGGSRAGSTDIDH